MQHHGISLSMEGIVNLQLSSKSVGVFEAFYNSVKVSWRGRTKPVCHSYYSLIHWSNLRVSSSVQSMNFKVTKISKKRAKLQFFCQILVTLDTFHLIQHLDVLLSLTRLDQCVSAHPADQQQHWSGQSRENPWRKDRDPVWVSSAHKRQQSAIWDVPRCLRQHPGPSVMTSYSDPKLKRSTSSLSGCFSSDSK